MAKKSTIANLEKKVKALEDKFVRCKDAEETALEMEKRVEERTKELAKANDQLKREIEERKQTEEALIEEHKRKYSPGQMKKNKRENEPKNS